MALVEDPKDQVVQSPASTPVQEDPHQGSQDSVDEAPALDDILENEQTEIDEIEAANQPDDAEEGEEAAQGEEGEDPAGAADDGDEDDDDGEYKAPEKYSVYGVEKDIPENIKSILNKKNEPVIRDLLTRADGLEEMRTRHSAQGKELGEVKTNYNTVINRVGQIMNHKKVGDLDSFFDAVQLTPEQVAGWVLERARIAALPPEEQRVYHEREAYRRQLLQAQPQIAQAEQSVASTQVQARIAELDNALSDSQVKRLAENFDSRNGNGAFRKAIMSHGAHIWHSQQKDVLPKEAIESFVKTYGLQLPKAPPKPGVAATRRVVARPKAPTIPKFSGSQAAVTGTRKPTSIADLKAIHKEKFGG